MPRVQSKDKIRRAKLGDAREFAARLEWMAQDYNFQRKNLPTMASLAARIRDLLDEARSL